MREHYQAELQVLREEVASLSRKVVGNVDNAAAALLELDEAKARSVLHAEHAVDFAEVRIEEECQKIIALHQPVADDLRFLIGIMKVDHELERISDLAVCIACRVPRLSPEALARYCDDLRPIIVDVRTMVQDSLNALLNRDAAAAKSIWRGDDTVDNACERLSQRIQADILSGAAGKEGFDLLGAVADLERIADHGTNIAKNAIYLILGRIVRHRGRELAGCAAGEKVKVLFVCVHNSARSQMAAAWMNHLCGDRYHAESAGLMPGSLNPLAVAVMREAGVDISGNAVRDVFEVAGLGIYFDYVITVCDAVNAERCPPVLGIAEQIQWEFEDPSLFSGSDEEKLARVRSVRDTIRRRIEEWVEAVGKN